MYEVSSEFLQAIRSRTRQLKCKAKLQTSDGTTYDLDDDKDIIDGTMKVQSAIMTGEFEIGSCNASDFFISLNNADGQWNSVNMEGATIWPEAGVVLPDDTVQYVPLGVFIVDRPSRPYSVLNIQASDRMILLDEPLSRLNVNFPIEARTLLSAIGQQCHVPISPDAYEQKNMTCMLQRPGKSSELSCRDAVSQIATLAGGYATMNRSGALEIKTFNKIPLLNRHTWDERKHEPLTWGNAHSKPMTWDEAGGIVDRTTWDELKNAGITWENLTRKWRTWDMLKTTDYNAPELEEVYVMPAGSRYTFEQTSDHITITGMRYGGKLWGTDDYVIEIEPLELVPESRAEAVFSAVWESINGISYTACKAEYPGNPAIDCGDVIWHMTKDGKSIVTYVTGHTYKHRGKSTILSEGKTKAYQSYRSANLRRLSRVAAKVHDEVEEQLTSYQQATAEIADMIAQALGVYGPTSVKQANGTNIYYLHDHAKLEDSKTVWRFDGQWLAISDDGGRTWNGGISAQSKLVMRVIDAVKINTDQLAANAVTAEKIAANAITAQKIAAKAITAEKIEANAVTAQKIKSGAITAEKIAANAITAEKVAANAITAEKIAANAITAQKIAANAITAEKIMGKSIGADKLKVDEILGKNATFSGTIKGAKIIASTIETTSLTAGSINGRYMQVNTDGTSHSRYQQSDYMNAYYMSAYNMSAYDMQSWRASSYSATAQTFNFQSGQIQSGVDIGGDMHVSPTGLYVNGSGYVCSLETVGGAWLGIHRGRDDDRFNASNLIWAVTTNGQIVTSDLSTKKDLCKIDAVEATNFIKGLSYWKYKRKADDVERLGIVANFLKYSDSPLSKYVLTEISTRENSILAADYMQLSIINAAVLKSLVERVEILEKQLKPM